MSAAVNSKEPVMNFDKLVARAQKILLEPRNEWSVIAGESSTTGDIYRNYLLYLCLLYTSDAADERSSVDIGGCRII